MGAPADYERVRAVLAGLDRAVLAAGVAAHLQRLGSGALRDPGNAALAGGGAVALIDALLGEGGPAAAQQGARASFSPRFSPADWSTVGAALLVALAEAHPEGIDGDMRQLLGQVWGEAVAAASAASPRAAAGAGNGAGG